MPINYHPYRLSTGFDKFDSEATSESPLTSEAPQSRQEIVDNIKQQKYCDILIVGGGIHGACMARLAAFNGLRTILLEKNDYASGTSSRSSKMAHGGLRYLEMFDFAQVFEGIRAREELFAVAPHLVKPTQFLIPLEQSKRFYRRKLGLGLYLYDLLVRVRQRKHRWIEPEQELAQSLKLKLSSPLEGYFQYTDGLMRDTRLVLENITAARQEGAFCLNYAEVNLINQRKDGRVEVGWTDLKKKQRHEIDCGIVINCAGPWVPFCGRLTPSPLADRIAYSQGTHLIFNKTWPGPPIFLPLQQKGRYYWIWPHRFGTMVGTTERPIDRPVEDPLPFPDEIEEILQRLKLDVPEHGLDRSCLHYCFAGIRTLALKKAASSPSALSRRPLWAYSQGVLSLIGGKFTTAQTTVEQGLAQVFKLSNLDRKLVNLKSRLLPGASGLRHSEKLLQDKVPSDAKELLSQMLDQYGSRATKLIDYQRGTEVISNQLFRGEIELAIDYEQVESLEDLMRRRLEIEQSSDHGLKALPQIIEILKSKRPEQNWEQEALQYRERMRQMHQLMQIP